MSGRFELRDRPVSQPGCCYICSGINGPFVDTRKDELGWGAVIICSQCVVTLFRTLGLEDLAQRVFSSQLMGTLAQFAETSERMSRDIGASLTSLVSHAGDVERTVEKAAECLHAAFAQREREVELLERRVKQEAKLAALTGDDKGISPFDPDPDDA